MRVDCVQKRRTATPLNQFYGQGGRATGKSKAPADAATELGSDCMAAAFLAVCIFQTARDLLPTAPASSQIYGRRSTQGPCDKLGLVRRRRRRRRRRSRSRV
jgi:hypothetical protein